MIPSWVDPHWFETYWYGQTPRRKGWQPLKNVSGTVRALLARFAGGTMTACPDRLDRRDDDGHSRGQVPREGGTWLVCHSVSID